MSTSIELEDKISTDDSYELLFLALEEDVSESGDVVDAEPKTSTLSLDTVDLRSLSLLTVDSLLSLFGLFSSLRITVGERSLAIFSATLGSSLSGFTVFKTSIRVSGRGSLVTMRSETVSLDAAERNSANKNTINFHK